jgi:UDP-N-acetylglucosamine--N-acetylmuramyl-(pentapeptide) pyrophosphoryl-undecaprenol N-acetylglucosamine transferase
MGGSQGSVALNEVAPQALGRVATGIAHIANVEVLHQVGAGREAFVREAYARSGIARASVVAFIDDVAGAIAAADLVIARAGAATIAEMTSIGRPAILIPFPYAAGDHQLKNARALAKAGAALCVEQKNADATGLADAIEGLLADDERRSAMAEASRRQGRPHAAHDVATDLLSLAGIPLLGGANDRGGHPDQPPKVSTLELSAGRLA